MLTRARSTFGISSKMSGADVRALCRHVAWQGERHGRPLRPAARGAVAGISIIASLLLAKLGLVALVAKGYGSVAWVSLGIYVVPLLAVGSWRVLARPLLSSSVDAREH